MTRYLNDPLLGYLTRHFVQIIVEFEEIAEHPEANKERFHCVSGFVLSVENYWFLMTAGHILFGIEQRIKLGQKIARCRLFDGWGMDATDLHSIPFDFKGAPRWHHYDENQGVDYGLISLAPYYRRLLASNGVIALDQHAWRNPPDDTDRNLLIGLPSKLQEFSVDNENGSLTGIKSRLSRILVTPTLSPPDSLRKSHHRYYATIPDKPLGTSTDGIPVTSIDGMSGGPIFGFKKTKDNKSLYWLLAVQSGWDETTRTIAACPVELVVRSLEELFITLRKIDQNS